MIEKKTLYVVATPIGNLGDITYRAVQTLMAVDFIMAEDTRHSSALLSYYEIKKELISYHSHTADGKAEKLLQRITKGENAALISDAGTPCISDPGVAIISLACKLGINIVPIPGVSAMTTLLSVSALPVTNALFAGFLSSKNGTRKNQLKNIFENEKKIIVCYESVHRIKNFMNDVKEVFGSSCYVVLGRELTKQFEQIIRDEANNILDYFENKNIVEKGEFTIIIDNRK